jgi:predicted Zn-dependent protease
MSLGDAEGAERWLRKAVAADPYSPAASYQLLLCLNQRGKADEAERLAARNERLRAANERVNHILTVDLMKGPPTAALCQEVGALLMETGRDRPAVYWLTRGLRLDPSHAPSHKLLAEYWERVGDAERAAAERQALRQLEAAAAR